MDPEIFTKALQPLSFDRVNNNRAPTSTFPTFRFPIELFHEITPHIRPKDLDSLALVDRDCCQLVRSIRFTDVTLTSELHLLLSSRENSGLGACIRRLNVNDLPFTTEIQRALPNLLVLNWEGSALEIMDDSPIRHLKLCGGVQQFKLPKSRWELETLVMRWSSNFDFVDSLLHQVSQSLDTLILEASPSNITSLSLPELRTLVLDNVAIEWFAPRLESLSTEKVPIARIPTLETLHCNDDDDSESFIQSNYQLSTITSVPLQLLPLLDVMENLTTLHVVVPVSSSSFLKQIASIQSLRNIWLAGSLDWAIDHDALLEELLPLRHLEHLAFTEDTYSVPVHPLRRPGAGYYTTKAFPLKVDFEKYLTTTEHAMLREKDLEAALKLRDEMMICAWERWHAEQMVGHAANYAKKFPCLRWCYIGQLAIELENLVAGARLARTTVLGRVWGIDC
ncbi:hypothetical protein C8J56DRAFT_326686 [Mycena floridula]|nr:hypothetical protein C8J56DRAFT_326686 [Mycena floridula]